MEEKQDTHWHFTNIKEGDLFHEMYSIYLLVMHISELGVISAVITLDATFTYRHFENREAFRKTCEYSSIPNSYPWSYKENINKDYKSIQQFQIINKENQPTYGILNLLQAKEKEGEREQFYNKNKELIKIPEDKKVIYVNKFGISLDPPVISEWDLIYKK